jgi:hypothetical protein
LKPPRSLASSVDPFISGYLLTLTTFGWPFVIAGSLKATCDLLLLRMFQNVTLPEEIEVAFRTQTESKRLASDCRRSWHLFGLAVQRCHELPL